MSMTQFSGNDNGQGAALEQRVREIRGYIERCVREGCSVHEVLSVRLFHRQFL